MRHSLVLTRLIHVSIDSVKMLKMSNCIKQDRLRSCGVCFGNFTKAGRFNLRITALDYLAQYAQVRVRLIFGAVSVKLTLPILMGDCTVQNLAQDGQ